MIMSTKIDLFLSKLFLIKRLAGDPIACYSTISISWVLPILLRRPQVRAIAVCADNAKVLTTEKRHRALI